MYYLKLNVKDVKLKSRAFNSLFEFFQFINIGEDTHTMLPRSVRNKFIVVETSIKPFYIPKYVAGSEYNIAELYDVNGNSLDFNLLFTESLEISKEVYLSSLSSKSLKCFDYKSIVEKYICESGELRADLNILLREDFDFALDGLEYNYYYFKNGIYHNIFSRQANLSRLIFDNIDKVNGVGNNYYRLIKHYGYNRNKCVIDYNDRMLRDEYGIGIGGSKSKMVTNWDDIYSSSKLSKCWKKHKVKKQYMKYKIMWMKKDPI